MCMVDYRCPSCDGGFPAPADACPWCGETLDGHGDDGLDLTTGAAKLAPDPETFEAKQTLTGHPGRPLFDGSDQT
jgi:hypothetical protein